jgi:hypothetical protein
MDPTPSWLRASSIDCSQSELSGAMLAEGFEGGRVPAADAGAALTKPAATELMTRCFPLVAALVRTGIGRKRREPKRSF